MPWKRASEGKKKQPPELFIGSLVSVVHGHTGKKAKGFFFTRSAPRSFNPNCVFESQSSKRAEFIIDDISATGEIPAHNNNNSTYFSLAHASQPSAGNAII